MKFCKNCGKELSDEALVCSACGVSQSAAAATTSEPAPGNGLSIASMICGIVSIIMCMPIASIPAIICAILAKKKGNTSGMTKAGLITGIIGAILGVLSFLFWIVYFIFIAGMSGYYYY